ncbi:hypothetical protein [Aneurinibacillus migulanus]|uniref:hypothetical protein n=1 Tax=Aneurinibacillus migulanus TaxID=47500 RepID=UPI001F27FF7B|nr:hypothetical protein [Aneurinibacillus migulanus]
MINRPIFMMGVKKKTCWPFFCWTTGRIHLLPQTEHIFLLYKESEEKSTDLTSFHESDVEKGACSI